MTKLFQTIIIFTLITSGAFADSINHDLVYFGDEEIYITKEGDNLRLKDKNTSKTLTELAAGSTSILSTNNTFTGTNEFDKGVDLQSESSNPNGSTTLWNKSNSWVCFGANKINETIGNVIKVAKDGSGNFTTIQGAIDSISGSSSTNRYTILIYPGVYDEQVTLNESYVSLVGVNKESCRIESNPAGATADNAVIMVTGSYCEIKNLHIENTYNSGTDGESALNVGVQTFYTFNCDYESGGRDVVWVTGAGTESDCIFENCYIRADYDVVSIYNDIRLYNCRVEKNIIGSSAFIWSQCLTKNISIIIRNNSFISGEACYKLYAAPDSYTITLSDYGNYYSYYTLGINGTATETDGIFNCNTQYIENYLMVGDNPIYNLIVDNNGYTKSADLLSYGKLQAGGNAVITGTLQVGGAALFGSNATISGTANLSGGGYTYASFIFGGDSEGDSVSWNPTTSKLEWNAFEESADTNLYRGGANELKTDDDFSANSFKTGSTERISSAGVVTSTQTNTDNVRIDGNSIITTDSNGNLALTPNGSGEVDISKVDIDSGSVDATTLSGNTAYWKDFSALAMTGNVGSYQVAGVMNAEHGRTPLFWYPNAAENPTHIQAIGSLSTCYYPIENIAGSVITQIRVKWQAQAANDGVKLALVKRDESGTATAWTVVGSEQTYTDSGSPYDVTVSTYNPADETMTANYSYAIRVTSVVATTGVNLYAVGVETSKRVY